MAEALACNSVWEPRLAKAAEAEAEELARLLRTASEQRASCAQLARPRDAPCEEPPLLPGPGPVRSWSEQRARACALAEPRRLLTADGQANERPLARTAAEQQRNAAVLAQPRMPKTDWMEELWPGAGRS